MLWFPTNSKEWIVFHSWYCLSNTFRFYWNFDANRVHFFLVTEFSLVKKYFLIKIRDVVVHTWFIYYSAVFHREFDRKKTFSDDGCTQMNSNSNSVYYGLFDSVVVNFSYGITFWPFLTHTHTHSHPYMCIHTITLLTVTCTVCYVYTFLNVMNRQGQLKPREQQRQPP